MGNNQDLGLGRGDIFKQVKGEMKAIEKSRSRSDIKIQNQLQKSASKSRFLDEIRVRRSRAQSAHSMTFDEDFNAMKMPDAEEQKKIQKGYAKTISHTKCLWLPTSRCWSALCNIK